MAPEEDIPKGMQRLANVLKKHQQAEMDESG